MARLAAVLVAMVFLAAAVLGVRALVADPGEGDEPTTADTSPPAGAPTASATSTPDAPATPPDKTDDVSLDEQLTEVAAAVERIRGLTFATDPDMRFVTPDALVEEISGQLEEYTEEEADDDRRLLAALGAVDPEVDLRELLIRGFSQQVAGYYDPDTGELVVGTADPDESLSALGEVTLSHELEHALADQALTLPDLEAFEDGLDDQVVAAQALIEGDATLTMQQYTAEEMSASQQLALFAESLAQLEGLADAQLPYYLQRSLEFPYTDGLAFVSWLYEQGGWDAVDAAYTNPPRTTAEVLFPARYGSFEPTLVTLPAAPAGYETARTMEFGAVDMLALAEAPGDDPSRALADPLGLASEWQGGRAALFTSGAQTAVAVVVAGGPGLCDGIERWYQAAFPDARRTAAGVYEGGAQVAALACGDGEVRLGIGADQQTARALSASGNV